MSNENSNNQQTDFSNLRPNNSISSRISNKGLSSNFSVLKDNRTMRGLESDRTQNAQSNNETNVQELENKLFTAEQLIKQLRNTLEAKNREISEFEDNEREMAEILTLDDRAQAELDEGHSILELKKRIEELEEENEGLRVIQHMYDEDRFKLEELENALRESLAENEELYGYKFKFEEAESKISELQLALGEALEENEKLNNSI
ncbi:hypothetical protein CONCODRAFT_79076, partial [Conidiobolus coronatus NRRL 28638]